MSKTNFEILLEMNQEDIKNNTQYLGICPSLIEVKKDKRGAIVKMGIPESELLPITLGDRVPYLMLVDREVFERKQKENNKNK